MELFNAIPSERAAENTIEGDDSVLSEALSFYSFLKVYL
jgi:hypothetical protein